MPQRQAQSKSLRQTQRRTLVNRARKTRMRSAMRRAVEAAQGQIDVPAEEALAEAHSAIDKAAKRHIIHRRAAARKKSRLAAQIKALSAD